MHEDNVLWESQYRHITAISESIEAQLGLNTDIAWSVNDSFYSVQDTTVRPNEELYLLIPQISHWQW